MAAFLKILLALTVSGSLMALLLLALRYVLLRKMPSTAYYYLWLLVLLRFILPLPGLVQPETDAAPAIPAAVMSPDYGRPGTAPEREAIPAATLSGPVAYSEPAPGSADTSAPTTVRGAAVHIDPAAAAVTVWAAGTAASLAWYVVGYTRFSRALRRHLSAPDRYEKRVYAELAGKKHPRLRKSASVRTPMLLGIRKPLLVLPEGEYDRETLENIFRHELTHYRRHDIAYKWFAGAVLSAQWFNPLAYLIRREINVSCELSCDESVISRMDREEKQSYGETLLTLASPRPLPAAAVATSLATEKRNIKKRLEQIMYYKKTKSAVMAAILSALLLVGCGTAVGAPATEEAPAPEEAAENSHTVSVSTVDELLAAIAPDTEIILAPGTYDLSTASDYGKTVNGLYTWEEVYDGYELVLQNISGLKISGEGAVIAAIPRYANVIRCVGCEFVSFEGFTAGHSVEHGFCVGGVIRLENCRYISLDKCRLYGCGVIGLWAEGCEDLYAYDTDIYDCSYEGVDLNTCRNVELNGCRFYDYQDADTLLRFESSDSININGCEIYDSQLQRLMMPGGSTNVYFTGNSIRNCTFLSDVFALARNDAVVDACEFSDCSIITWFNGSHPVNAAGEMLNKEDMLNMVLGEPVQPAPTPELPAVSESAEGVYEVATVDEFLSAIGPDRTIVLTAELYDLSTASDYGGFGGEYYKWRENYDGPELCIVGVNDLTIRSADGAAEKHTIAAIPRYANVLYLESCENLILEGFTAGHTKEPGSCSGGVIYLQNCVNTALKSCRLYGCGILGLQTHNCDGLSVFQTEIYECSQGGVNLFLTNNAAFTDCDFHDLPEYNFQLNECENVLFNGEKLANGSYSASGSSITEYVFSDMPDRP